MRKFLVIGTKLKLQGPFLQIKREFSKTAPPGTTVMNTTCFVSAYEANQVLNKDGIAVLKFY